MLACSWRDGQDMIMTATGNETVNIGALLQHLPACTGQTGRLNTGAKSKPSMMRKQKCPKTAPGSQGGFELKIVQLGETASCDISKLEIGLLLLLTALAGDDYGISSAQAFNFVGLSVRDCLRTLPSMDVGTTRLQDPS